MHGAIAVVAREVAESLWSQLESGKLAKIGIEEVRAAIPIGIENRSCVEEEILHLLISRVG